MAEKKTDLSQPRTISFPSTYSVLTAERILEKFNLTLSKHRVKSQVFHTDTFFHKLMYLPARQLGTEVHYEQCRDIQAYAQQKLIHYLFSGETAKSDKEAGADFRASIEAKRVKLVNMGKELVGWHESQLKMTAAFSSTLAEKVKAWHETVKEVVSEALTLLEKQSVPTDETVSDALSVLLLDHAAGIKISDELRTQLKLKDPIGTVEKAVVSLFAKDKDKNSLDKSKMKKLKVPFQTLDKKLNLIIDEVGGMNTSESAQIEEAKEHIKNVTKQFASEASHITHHLHEYFQRYGKDEMKVLTTQDAFQQGVDTDVADDYNALKGSLSG